MTSAGYLIKEDCFLQCKVRRELKLRPRDRQLQRLVDIQQVVLWRRQRLLSVVGDKVRPICS